jgi:hypothetical protein
MADLFKKTDPANPLFPQDIGMPPMVPSSFDEWNSNPENRAKASPSNPQLAASMPPLNQVPQSQPPALSGGMPQAPEMPSIAQPQAAPQLKAPVPGRPDSPYAHLSGKQTLGMGLATALDNIGAALDHGQASVGHNWLDSLNHTRQAQMDYDTNLPRLQYDVNQAATNTALGQSASRASTAHTEQETKNLGGQLSPADQRKAAFVGEIQKEAETGKYSPDALRAKIQRMAIYNKIDMRPEEIEGLANTKPVGAAFSIKDEGGYPVGVTRRDGSFCSGWRQEFIA